MRKTIIIICVIASVGIVGTLLFFIFNINNQTTDNLNLTYNSTENIENANEELQDNINSERASGTSSMTTDLASEITLDFYINLMSNDGIISQYLPDTIPERYQNHSNFIYNVLQSGDHIYKEGVRYENQRILSVEQLSNMNNEYLYKVVLEADVFSDPPKSIDDSNVPIHKIITNMIRFNDEGKIIEFYIEDIKNM